MNSRLNAHRNASWIVATLALGTLALPASAATLCTSAAGTAGCYPTINAAVAAASPNDVVNIGPGVYKEAVILAKPISIVGNGATIDATGFAQGILVNGAAATKLAGIHISGFTVKNANLEGILVLNASDVTVANNTVANNNLALVNGNCTMLPANEPGEAMDCGEGVHLQAAYHTIVTNNIITGNSGGILISDDTGASHDNLVTFNTVRDNPYACGITMAGHTPNSAALPTGVYHNTVYGNRSIHNGIAAGGGAGVGVFASAPGTASYGNVIVDNYLSQNGHPGISMHSHTPGQILNDNMLVGNTIVANGPDPTVGVSATDPMGISLAAVSPATGNIISGNSVQNETYDIGVNNPALVQIQFNTLHDQFGIDNVGAAGPIDATENYWACGSGPSTLNGCSQALGPNLITAPWLTQSIPSQPTY